MPRWASPGLPSLPGQAQAPRGAVRGPVREAPHSPAPPPLTPTPNASAFGRVGYYALLAYLFLYQSRILELTLPRLRITMILNLIFLVGVVFSGGLARCLRSRVFILLVGFFCWLVISSPFSVWRGGSLRTVLDTARAIVIMAAIMALVSTTRDCFRLMHVLGFAGVAAAGMSVALGKQDPTERLTLAGGSLSDPNLYCVLLYVGLPFLWLAARNASQPLYKLICIAATAPILGAGVGTGSRTGFIALCVMILVLFLRLSGIRKLRLLVAAAGMLGVASLVFSQYILERYITLFEVQAREGLTEEQMKYLGTSAASAGSRLYLLQRSLETTLKRPLFGVGPGMFPVALDQEAKAGGQRRAEWHQTHNTYTQVSAEAGIPAFLLYMAALCLTYRTLWRLRKGLTPPATAEQERARHGVVYLEVAFLGALAAATFLSMAYVGFLYILMGLVLALERAVVQEHLGPSAPSRGSAPPLGPRLAPGVATV